MPSLDEQSIIDDDIIAPGEFSASAAKLIMNVRRATRMCRYDLLYLVTALTREMSRWTRACDKRLFRLMCYVTSNVTLSLASLVGDSLRECKLLLLTDSDRTSVYIEIDDGMMFCFG